MALCLWSACKVSACKQVIITVRPLTLLRIAVNIMSGASVLCTTLYEGV